MDPGQPQLDIDIRQLDALAEEYLRQLGERYIAELEPTPISWVIRPAECEVQSLSHLRLKGLVKRINAYEWTLTEEGAQAAVAAVRDVSPSFDGIDVIVLTAITLEYQAALKVEAGAWSPEPWRSTETADGLPLAVRTFHGKGGAPLRIGVTQAGDMGTVAATNALLPLVNKHAPRCIAMCGVCAGRPGKTNLGDVVAADRLFFHDSGKQLPDQVQQDLRTYNLPDDWKIALEHFDFVGCLRDRPWWRSRPIPYEWQENWVLAQMRDGVLDPSALSECGRFCPQWERVIKALWEAGDVKNSALALTDQGTLRAKRLMIQQRNRFPDLSPDGATLPFRVHVAPMGSGNKVIEDSAVWSFVSEHMRRTLGIEMEAAALGALVHAQRNQSLRALVMKGVMDFANNGRDDHFKLFAARASAECLIVFLREHLDLEAR